MRLVMREAITTRNNNHLKNKDVLVYFFLLVGESRSFYTVVW
jgi:hypothetical protein